MTTLQIIALCAMLYCLPSMVILALMLRRPA